MKTNIALAGLMALPLVVGMSGAAMAQASAEAKLKTAVTTPVKTEIDGRIWTCEGDVCHGAGDGQPQSLKRECKSVAATLGPLAAYRSDNGEAKDAVLVACNTPK